MEEFRLFISIIPIIFGIILKVSNREDLKTSKKYWLFLIIAGILLFILRLYDLLK
jgi:energy-converting hydrogenase Eha subunit H